MRTSIAYSDSASGVYIETVLYKKLDVSDAVRAKSKMIPAEPVGEVVARGDAALGFQQVSELLPIKGIDVLGTDPGGNPEGDGIRRRHRHAARRSRKRPPR